YRGAVCLCPPWMRARADVQRVEQPGDVDEPGDADHDVDDVGQRARAEDVRQHVGVAVRDADDAPVEGADDHQEQDERLESPQHLHRSPPCESDKVTIATYLHPGSDRVTAPAPG